MNHASSITAVLAAIVTTACVIGTTQARVCVAGRLEQPASQPQCQLYLVDASATPEVLTDGRDVSGPFAEWFTVHPWGGPYRAVVKCGERIAISQVIQYWEFKPEPYDLGRIALY
jgi:hypothetical protein